MTEDQFRAFYAETMPALWRYVARVSMDPEVADEITQESYLRLLRAAPARLGQEDRRRYLFRIATNQLNDHFRASHREQVALSDDLVGTDGKAEVEAAALSEDLDESLQSLAPRMRELLVLAYIEGYSHRDIASITGLQEQSIRPLLYRARRALAQVLRARGYDDAAPAEGER
jgi:RNA polymerase sigma-70 factor (ECF subfamily)